MAGVRSLVPFPSVTQRAARPLGLEMGPEPWAAHPAVPLLPATFITYSSRHPLQLQPATSSPAGTAFIYFILTSLQRQGACQCCQEAPPPLNHPVSSCPNQQRETGGNKPSRAHGTNFNTQAAPNTCGLCKATKPAWEDLIIT